MIDKEKELRATEVATKLFEDFCTIDRLTIALQRIKDIAEDYDKSEKTSQFYRERFEEIVSITDEYLRYLNDK